MQHYFEALWVKIVTHFLFYNIAVKTFMYLEIHTYILIIKPPFFIVDKRHTTSFLAFANNAPTFFSINLSIRANICWGFTIYLKMSHLLGCSKTSPRFFVSISLQWKEYQLNSKWWHIDVFPPQYRHHHDGRALQQPGPHTRQPRVPEQLLPVKRKRGPKCLFRCLRFGKLHPAQCHMFCWVSRNTNSEIWTFSVLPRTRVE